MLEWRFGATGGGIFAGCGVGVGLIAPVSLNSIPVLGEVASSVTRGLGQLDAMFGGVGATLRGRARAVAGPRGLDAGAGCGVMLGYGWGAGFMLQPNAVAQLQVAASEWRERLFPGSRWSHKPEAQAVPLSAPAVAYTKYGSGSEDSNSSDAIGSSSNSSSSPAALQREVDEVMRMVVRQQNEIASLKSAVCKLDPKASCCKIGDS